MFFCILQQAAIVRLSKVPQFKGLLDEVRANAVSYNTGLKKNSRLECSMWNYRDLRYIMGLAFFPSVNVDIYKLSQSMTKPTKWPVHPTKTWISICPVWSEASLSAWRKAGSLAIHKALSQDADQTWQMPRLIGQMPRLICVFAGQTSHFVGFVMLMRLWYFSSFVTSLFKRACAAFQWGYMSDFGRTLRLFPYFMCANSEGSGETARTRRLARAFAGRQCDKYHNLMSWLI